MMSSPTVYGIKAERGVSKGPLAQLPFETRPRERLLSVGADALSSVELLAILLVTGTKGKSVLHLAQDLLGHFGSLEVLLEASVEELTTIKGIGKAKAIQLKAAFSLAVRAAPFCERPPIHSAKDAYQMMYPLLEGRKQEMLVVLSRDIKGKAIFCETVAIGTLSSVLTHPREVFHSAIRRMAHSVIVGHNHPSGDPAPSLQDIELTHLLVHAGKILGIALDDHLIIGAKGYLSFKEEGFFDVTSRY